MNMEYRLGTKRDLDAICSLIREAIGVMEKNGIDQWDEVYPARNDFEEDIRKQTLYLAFQGQELIALYSISRDCDDQYQNAQWENDGLSAIILHRFCVSPRFQNRGIGKLVLQHIEEQVRDLGYRSIRLDVFTGNPFAQKLYLHHGYVPRGYADWRKGRFALLEKELQETGKAPAMR